MPVVSFLWDAQLVAIRREAVPRAQWDKVARRWSCRRPQQRVVAIEKPVPGDTASIQLGVGLSTGVALPVP